MNAQAPAALIEEFPKGSQNGPEQIKAPMLVEDHEKVVNQLAEPIFKNGLDGLGFPVPADRPAGKKGFKLRVLLEDFADEELEAFQNGVALLLHLGGIEKGLGVDARDALRADIAGDFFRVFVVTHARTLAS
jgi:hypothetical protein